MYRAVVEVLPSLLMIVPINFFVFEKSDSSIGIEDCEVFMMREPRAYVFLCDFAIIVGVFPTDVWLVCPNRMFVK